MTTNAEQGRTPKPSIGYRIRDLAVRVGDWLFEEIPHRGSPNNAGRRRTTLRPF